MYPEQSVTYVPVRSLFFRLIRQLSTMPYSYDPHGLIFHAIKKTIWMHDYFAKGELRKLRQQPS